MQRRPQDHRDRPHPPGLPIRQKEDSADAEDQQGGDQDCLPGIEPVVGNPVQQGTDDTVERGRAGGQPMADAPLDRNSLRRIVMAHLPERNRGLPPWLGIERMDKRRFRLPRKPLDPLLPDRRVGRRVVTVCSREISIGEPIEDHVANIDRFLTVRARCPAGGLAIFSAQRRRPGCADIVKGVTVGT